MAPGSANIGDIHPIALFVFKNLQRFVSRAKQSGFGIRAGSAGFQPDLQGGEQIGIDTAAGQLDTPGLGIEPGRHTVLH